MSSPARHTPEVQQVAPSALEQVAYLYDGSIEGLLSAVFESYVRKEYPEDIVCENEYQPRLGQSLLFVETSMKRAERVRSGLEREAGRRAFVAVLKAWASDDPGKGRAVLDFIRYAMDERPKRATRTAILSELANPVVERIVALKTRTDNEIEKTEQFVRFSHLANGVWFARCNPNVSVLPFVMPYFAARFNIQPFMIYDETHRLAGVYDGSGWHLVHGEVEVKERRAEGDEYAEALWQRFYDSVAIADRYNPELRRHFMPMRLWRNLPEMQPRKSALVRN